MMALFSKILALRRSHGGKSPADVYTGLRQMILTKRPANFSGFWGVVMDMGMPNGTATMIAVADGTVSMYTSTGAELLESVPMKVLKESHPSCCSSRRNSLFIANKPQSFRYLALEIPAFTC